MDSETHGLEAQGHAPLVLHVESFDPLVGKTARFSGSTVVLVLDQIICDRAQVLPSYIPRRPFVLIFRGPKSQDRLFRDLLPEGFYVCTFGDDLSYDFQIAPIHTPEPDRQLYQAVFN